MDSAIIVLKQKSILYIFLKYFMYVSNRKIYVTALGTLATKKVFLRLPLAAKLRAEVATIKINISASSF